jgi:hypothetical protein
MSDKSPKSRQKQAKQKQHKAAGVAGEKQRAIDLKAAAAAPAAKKK